MTQRRRGSAAAQSNPSFFRRGIQCYGEGIIPDCKKVVPSAYSRRETPRRRTFSYAIDRTADGASTKDTLAFFGSGMGFGVEGICFVRPT